MRRISKKALSLVLAAALCLALAVPALAAEQEFEMDEAGVLTKYNGSGGEVAVPDGVTAIGEQAFMGCAGLTEVTIPDGVTSIGRQAFGYCTGLTGVTLPDSVTTIGEGAFWGCAALTSFTIPQGVTEIGALAFSNCTGLTELTIPGGVAAIGDRAFGGCTGLERVTVSEGVTAIGMTAFGECTGLTSVTLPDTVTEIGIFAFTGCTGLTEITLPHSLTTLGGCAFQDCTGLERVTIPAGVSTIEEGAFMGCTGLAEIGVEEDNENYISVDGVLFTGDGKTLVAYPGGKGGEYALPEGTEKIETYAMRDCPDLTGAAIPASVTEIGAYGFIDCPSLAAIQVSGENPAYTSVDGVLLTKDGSSLLAYPGGKQGGYTIPDGVTQIGDQAFHHCGGLTMVTVPGSVDSIGLQAFGECENLLGVNLSEGLTTIGAGAFLGCTTLARMDLPGTVTTIGPRAFNFCSNLRGIAIPEGVETIDDFTFDWCRRLTGVYIPKSVTSINQYAFFRCGALTDIYYAGSEADWEAIECNFGDFRNDLADAAIHYNSGPDDLPELPPLPEPQTAEPTNDLLTVDGRAVAPAAYKIDGVNYFDLRDVALMLSGTPAQFSIGLDPETMMGTLTTGGSVQGGELSPVPTAGAEGYRGSGTLLVNGSEVKFTVYRISGGNYYSIRELGEALGFNVGWDPRQGMFIETGKPYDSNN